VAGCLSGGLGSGGRRVQDGTDIRRMALGQLRLPGGATGALAAARLSSRRAVHSRRAVRICPSLCFRRCAEWEIPLILLSWLGIDRDHQSLIRLSLCFTRPELQRRSATVAGERAGAFALFPMVPAVTDRRYRQLR